MTANFFKLIAAHFANETGVITPNGKKLAGSPEDGLAKWKQLSEAERKTLEDLGKYDAGFDPAPPAGGLIVKVFARGLSRDSAGVLGTYKDPKVPLSQEPGRDFLWLTQAECKSLVPEQATKGATLMVPEPIADRLCRRYLIDLVRIGGNGGPRQPQHVASKQLKLTVEEPSPPAPLPQGERGARAASVRLRLDGSAECLSFGENFGISAKESRKDTFQLLGFLDYDKSKNTFTRFDIVALSETGHYDEIMKKVLPLGVAFELAQGDKPAERLPPASFAKDYFGKSQ